MEHAGKDNKSHTLSHTLQSGHPPVSPNRFRIIQKVYKNNKVKKKISEPHRKGFWLKQNNKCNARDQASDVVLRKLLCVKYLRRHV